MKNQTIFFTILIISIFYSCNLATKEKSIVSDSINKTVTTKIETNKIPDEVYKSTKLDEIGFELLEKELISGIRIGTNALDLVNIIGEPTRKSKSELWGADGFYHQTWFYESKGLELDIVSENKNIQNVGRITVTIKNSDKTQRNIGIGNTMQEVKEAYKKSIDNELTSENSLTAGTVFGGIIFSFKDNKLTEIFIGAASE